MCVREREREKFALTLCQQTTLRNSAGQAAGAFNMASLWLTGNWVQVSPSAYSLLLFSTHTVFVDVEEG